MTLDRKARAAIRLAIDEVRTAPGSDWGPEHVAGDAFADILGDLLALLEAGDPGALARLAAEEARA
jgi:hypothetical protein